MDNMNGWGWMPQQNYRQFGPHYEIIKVNGEQGARAFNMGPNSNCFLADTTNPNLIWLAQTDGAGYLTVTPLDVNVHTVKPQPDINALEERIKHLEDMYGQINSGISK